MLRFIEWMAFDEMAARRSFSRSLAKFDRQVVDKPVAIITAFQGGPVVDAAGNKITDSLAQLVYNRQANMTLIDDLKDLDLSFYPVKGAGQEEARLFGFVPYVVPSDEESFIVQPKGEISEADFLSDIQIFLRHVRTVRRNGQSAQQSQCISALPGR